MTTTTELTVRPYELDSYNHVNNAVYQNYLEHARMDFLKQIGFEYERFFAQGMMLYVTRVEIFYKGSARLHDKLFIETESAKLGIVKGTMHQLIKKEDGTIITEANVDWACVNKDGRPVKIPDEFIVKGLKPENQ